MINGNGNGNGGGPACSALPDLGSDLTISLPFGGGQLTAIRDITKGIPNDCTLTFSLLVQLPPLLASLGCFLKLLDVMAKLKEFVDKFTGFATNPTQAGEVVSAAGELVGALGKVAPCFPGTPAVVLDFKNMICDILRLIANLLRCMLQFLSSINDFQAKIDLGTAEDNPALLDVLKCAQDNSQLTAAHVLAALGPILPLIEAVKPLGEFAEIELDLPDLSTIHGDDDITDTIEQLEAAAVALEQVVEGICG